MRIISTLLVTLYLVAIAFAQPSSYPALPLEFSADVQIKVESSQSPFPMPGVSGTMYYSYIQQLQRIDSTDPFFGQTTTTLDRYDQMNEYNYQVGAGCKCSPITAALPQYTVLPGSTYNGQSNVNGVESDEWVFSLSAGINITLFVDPTQNVLTQAVMIVNQQGSTFTTTMSFSNVNTQVDSSVFVVPAMCSNTCPTPAPPQTPSPTACPSNPPHGCQCASSLSFCSGVTYPIFSADSASLTDSMVEQTFNNFVSFAQPSSACQNNMKSFLCATMFPLCTANSAIPMPILPCPSLCPSCSCTESGATGNNTCAAALPSTICTQYGQGFC